MKETGILFKGDMVRAILRDKYPKTMTRRTYGLESINLNPNAYKFCRMEGNLAVFEQTGFTMVEIQPTIPRRSVPKHTSSEGGNVQFWIECPYGTVGDLLWCKETWATAPNFDSVKPSDLPDGIIILRRADNGATRGKWRSAMFMRRKDSRIDLSITGLRAERLHDINEDDAKKEGMAHPSQFKEPLEIFDGHDFRVASTYRDVFISKWNFRLFGKQ